MLLTSQHRLHQKQCRSLCTVFKGANGVFVFQSVFSMGSSRVVVAWPRADFHRSHPYVASTNTACTPLGIGSQTQMARLKIMKEKVFQLKYSLRYMFFKKCVERHSF